MDMDFVPTELPPLSEVADALGVTVSYAPFRGHAYGSFNPQARIITLASPDVSVFFHELAHAVHHTIQPLVGGQVPTQEIVAEPAAAALAALYGDPMPIGMQLQYV